MNRLFQEDLLKDEEILWAGQPDPSVLFTRADIFLVPFSLLWGGFAIFWEVCVLGVVCELQNESGALAFFPLFGLAFVLVGLYFIFGRFLYKIWKRKHTHYAVTNKRILVLTQLRRRDVQAAFINAIPSVNKSIRSDGVGTLRFGGSSLMTLMSSMYANTGMDFFGPFSGGDAPAFFDIKDANRVYQLVTDLRNR